MTTYKTIIGVCFVVIIGGVPASVLFINTQDTIVQSQQEATQQEQQQPVEATLPVNTYYYTSKYGDPKHTQHLSLIHI